MSVPCTVHPWLPEAASLHQAGRLGEAAALYERILAQDPENFAATHLLGVVALQESRFDQAEALIKAALVINPDDGAALTNLGTVYLRCGQLEAALARFERASRLEPVSPSTLENLGSVLRQLQRSHEAVAPLRRAHAMDPGSAAIGNLLGACLLDSNDAGAAAAVFAHVTRHDPESADGWANLSTALSACGDLEGASASALKAVALQPRSSSALASLAAVQLRADRVEEALATYAEAVDAPDPSAGTHCAYALALFRQEYVDDALEQLSLALTADPDNLLARWLLTMSQCKPIPEDEAEIDASRKSFSAHLEELGDWLAAAPRPGAFAVVGSRQPFYLAYQHFNNRDLLMRYGQLCARAMQTLPEPAPNAHEARGPTLAAESFAAGKLRLGIVTAHVRSHAVWVAVTRGIVQELDRAKFDLHLFQLDPQSDSETSWARKRVANFHEGPRDLQSWVAAIRAAKLDAIIFPEVGIDPLTLQLAAMRLAPVQATTWGHPQTSGLPTMDLYFSAEAYEPPGSETHYSERLVRLPKLGAWFEPWTIKTTDADLASLGVRHDEPLLLCPGMPFKYSPGHDRLWARIAKGLRRSRGRLVFFLGNPEEIPQRLELRLRRSFRAERLDFDKHVHVLPLLARSRFFGLMRRSALMLDTVGFSGFNTALHGVEAGLPVLAREGDFMRGRLASGIMRQLGLPELVARSDDEFVDKAIELAGDVGRRKALTLEIERRRPALFKDAAAIRALEDCLVEACGRS